MTGHAQGKSQKRPKNTLSLHLRHPQLRDSLWNQKTKTISKHSNKKQQTLGEGREYNFQSYHVTRFKCPIFNPKNHKVYKETGKYGPFKEIK